MRADKEAGRILQQRRRKEYKRTRNPAAKDSRVLEQEVIIEFHRIGNSVKVSAMDTKTLTEVSIVGPANAGEEILKRNVLRKLDYVLAKKKR